MRHYLKTFALVAVLALIVAACAGDDATEPDATTVPSGSTTVPGASETPNTVTHAAGSTADVYIPQYRAAEVFGDLFGLSTEDNLTAFEEGSLAAQVVVAGQLDVASGGFTPVVQVIESGVEAKAFCPIQMHSTEHLMGRTDVIAELEQITDPNVRVAVESAGGFLNLLMNLVFDGRGLGITTDDLTNTLILEDGSLRLSALAAGDVDVGSLDLFEQAELKAEIGEEAVTVLSVVAEDANFLANVSWAPKEWLDANRDLAARWCAAIIYSNRVVSADFDEYTAMLDQYIAGGYDEETARINWEFARDWEVFPLNATVLNEENIQTLIDISVETGIFEESSASLTFEDTVDAAVIALAMEYVGGEVTQEQIFNGDIPEPNYP